MRKITAGRGPPSPEAFSDAAPPGTKVWYYPILPDNDEKFIASEIISTAWTLGGRTVVKLQDLNGGKDVGHLVLIDPKKTIMGVAGIRIRDKWIT